MGRLLRDQGWTGPEPEPFSTPSVRWKAYQQAVLLGARLFSMVPGTISGFAFRDDETALAYALKYPRRRQSGIDHLALAQPMELA
jgi:hypothetical protein